MDPLTPILVIAALVVLALGADPLKQIILRVLAAREIERTERRSLETQARPAPELRLIAETMPDWVDPDDPEEVEAWKKARAETIRTTKTGDPPDGTQS